MTASQVAKRIVDTHAPELPERAELEEAIRLAIVQWQIEARQPVEMSPLQACGIAYQIVVFVDDWNARLRGSDYPEQANELQALRGRVLAVLGIAEKKPVGKATELKRVGRG